MDAQRGRQSGRVCAAHRPAGPRGGLQEEPSAVARRDPENREAQAEVRSAEEALCSYLREIGRVGAIFFAKFAHGILLFPSMTVRGEERQLIFFVLPDTRDAPESYVIKDELYAVGDLTACELPIPAKWWRVPMPAPKRRK